MGDSKDDSQSTTGYCFGLGFGIFSLSCMKKDIVAQSTIEDEFLVVAGGINQTLWLKKILAEFIIEPIGSIKVLVDNKAPTSISHNLVFHGTISN